MNTVEKQISNYIKRKTVSIIESGEFDLRQGIEASDIAFDLKMDRANVSRLLNNLWRNGDLIKLQGRPVVFLDYSVLNEYYPDRYVPLTISANETLQKFLTNKDDRNNIISTSINSIDQLIGANDSLAETIKTAKSAITYPPFGLHTLITGTNGTGKTTFAKCMYEYAINIKGNIPFEIVNCRLYSGNPEEFVKIMFGSAKKKNNSEDGIINKCSGGIILLENYESLDPSSQETVISVIKNNSYLSFYDRKERDLKAMFIITSYFLNIDEHSSAIERVIPIKIQLPDISNRGLFEKIELIFDIFKKEAKKIHTTLQVSKGVITSIGCVKYKDNIIEMQNTIQSICSKAYLEMEKNKYNTAYIDFESLPQRLLENTENDSNSSLAIANLLDCIQGNIISFDKDGNSSEADIFSKSPDSFKDLRTKQFINEFNVNVNDLDNIKDYVNETIDTLINCSEPQLRAIKNNIAPEVYKTVIRVIKERQLDNFLENTQLLFGIMLHVSNYLERAKHGKVEMNISERKSLFSETYPKEYSLAEDIYSVFEKSYGIKENIRETDFLASYFVAINQLSEKTNIGILLICHGNHVASELKMYAKEASNGSYYLDAIDYHKDMQFNDLLELACIKCSELNRGSGVLILCDTEPLTTVGDYVFKHVGIITRTIDNVSLLLLLKVIELSKSSFSGIDNLVIQFNNRKGILQKQNEIHNDYLDNLKDKVIRKTVSFIDVDKAVDALSICLNDTLQELSIPYTNAIATKYLCHCTNMLERVIKGNTLDFVAINSYISKNRGLMNIVEKNLEYAGNAFGIKIPAPEIAYVSQILLDS